jgi:hypothetical protein
MKTKNNIQKTALKTVVAATGLAILSLTVNAQGSMKSLFENNEINHIAMVMEKTYNSFASNNTRSFTDAEVFATYLTEETEEPLHLESWMVEENNFVMSVELEAETESPLEIEDWMTNESTFEVYSALLETETEEELNLEDWMMNENTFADNQNESTVAKTSSTPISTSTFFYREVNIEEKLEVENWMVNPKIWGK